MTLTIVLIIYEPVCAATRLRASCGKDMGLNSLLYPECTAYDLMCLGTTKCVLGE